MIPAFPGADGAGANVSGGRGGVVYHVTKLDQNFSDAVAGTLRYGLDDANFPAGTPRTIVFDVAGTFWLGRFGEDRGHFDGWDTQSRINIGTNVTLAGQTAPGPVNIMGGVIKFADVGGVSNSMVRNVLVAPGYGMRSFEKPDESPPEFPEPNDFPDSYVFDAFDVTATNVMVDHVSTFYATDETISVNEEGGNITIQYTNLAQAQNYPQADAEATSVSYSGHALGSLLQAGSNAKVSVVKNLYAHLAGRLPRVGSEVGTGPLNDFRNNVFYNWFGTAGSGGASGQPSFNNFINNFYLVGGGGDGVSQTAGPDGQLGTLDDVGVTTSQNGGTGIFSGHSLTRVYASGNLRDTNRDGDAADGTLVDSSYGGVDATTAYDVDIGATLDANSAYEHVLRYVGARWWERDYDVALGNTAAIDTVDERIVHETYTGTGKISAWADHPFNDYEKPFAGVNEPPPEFEAGYLDYDPDEGAEWRELLALRADPTTGAAPFNRSADWDVDGDGLPGFWEAAHGMDPNVPNNNADHDGDVYTAVEEYLNDIAAWPAPGTILFNGTNSNYADVLNWQVNGENVDIQGQGVVTTRSYWQPSRYDVATIHDGTVAVNATGQHAGWLDVAPDPGDDATLNIASGWLRVADTLEIAAAGGNGEVNLSADGALHVGTITKGPNGSFNFAGGVLNADVVGFDLVNDGGTIAPGPNVFDLPAATIDFAGPGLTQVAGDLTLNDGILEIEIESLASLDQVEVDGAADLGGALEVLAGPGLQANFGDLLLFLHADGGIFNAFDVVSLPALGDGKALRLVYGETLVGLEVVLAGDYNGNGTVDAADYTVWRDTLGQSGSGLAADGTGPGGVPDGLVDQLDYQFWKDRFGNTQGGPGGGSLASVPESASIVLALLAMAPILRRRVPLPTR